MAMTMDMEMYEETILKNLGQLIRIHTIRCEQHIPKRSQPYHLRLDPFCAWFRESSAEIYRMLEKSLYINYCTVIVHIDAACDCSPQILQTVQKKIALNEHLRYKTLLVVTSSKMLRIGTYVIDRFLEKFAENYALPASGVIYPKIWTIARTYAMSACSITDEDDYEQVIIENGRWVANRNAKKLQHYFTYVNSLSNPKATGLTKNDGIPVANLKNFLQGNMGNIIFLQLFTATNDGKLYMVELVKRLLAMPNVSINELLQTNGNINGQFVVYCNRNADFYLLSINPALAIIINAYYFTNKTSNIIQEDQTRKGSEHNVSSLIREMKVAQIPYILLQDLNREQFMELHAYMKTKDFHGLERLFIFLMAHGGLKHNIKLKNFKFDLFEYLLEPIQTNASLRNVKKFLHIIACRGDHNLNEISAEQLRLIRPTELDQPLDGNLAIFFSVPYGFRSKRSTKKTSQYIRELCKTLRTNSHERTKKFQEQLHDNLGSVKYYKVSNIRSELVTGENIIQEKILTERIKTAAYVRFIESILEDFPLKSHNSYRGLYCLEEYLGDMSNTKGVSFATIYHEPNLDEDDEIDSDNGKNIEEINNDQCNTLGESEDDP
ncbi:uncharacterized protein LOC106087738 [Stomoxys calcitrans]|uniref:uncharacterized protein LOC106087738 n=1 Tax=Stomoxys calcitrans TaxID=35570 RepID=UPI0027E3167C|nr:uncharacterized protein LOC106087738 [Stomoxys calcitrans]